MKYTKSRLFLNEKVGFFIIILFFFLSLIYLSLDCKITNPQVNDGTL